MRGIRVLLPSIPHSESSSQAADTEKAGNKREKRKIIRTKTGCITCRIRRVKCDETRPSCTRCTSTGRKCDGWTDIPTSRRDLPVAIGDRKSILLSCHSVSATSGFADNVERRYFDFFRSKTSPTTNQLFDCEFWSRNVLQLSHSEPAVKHAVLAISAFHQGWDLYGSSIIGVDRNSMLQYSKAVESAKGLLVRSQAKHQPDVETIRKVLVACILFICFENLICDYRSAAMHLGNGLKILADHASNQKKLGVAEDPWHGIGGEIVEVLQRYHFQSLTFAQSRYPYRQASERFHQGAPPKLPERFETMCQVRSCMFEKMIWAMSVGEVLALSQIGISQHPEKSCVEMAAEAEMERREVVEELRGWWTLFEDFAARESARTMTDFTKSKIYNTLAVYHQLALITSTGGCVGVESGWDDYVDDFRSIIERCESVIGEDDTRTPLSLELGICIPLFTTVTKCRHPEVRRRALRLCDKGNRKEGVWETMPAARVCERLMTIEEDEARQIYEAESQNEGLEFVPLTEKDIPEAARVQEIFTDVSLQKRYVKIRYVLRPGGDEEPLVTKHDRVDF